MPSFLDFSDDDEDEEEPKFGSDCDGCKNIRRPRICAGCDAGEFFDEKDPEGLDFFFR